MTRRASHAPSPKLHAMTATWTNPTNRVDSAPGELSTGGLKYNELLDRFDGKVHTVRTRDYPETDPQTWPAGLEPSNHYGETCHTCYVQKARNGDCMC